MLKLSMLQISKRRQKVKARGIKPSRKNELWYKGQLMSLVSKIRAHYEPVIAEEIKARMSVSDGYARDENPDWINRIVGDLQKSFRLPVYYAESLASIAAKKNSADVDAAFIGSIKNLIGIDVSALMAPHALAGMMEKATAANVYLIKSIPQEYFGRLQEAISANWQSGMRPESLIETVMRVGDVTESRAQLIARDQTSKMNSAFTQVRQLSVGINSYIWQTAGDERVREEHAALDGQQFRWDEPPDEGNPGEAVACRCVALPVIDQTDEEGFDPMGAINNAVANYEFGVTAAELARNSF